MASRFRTVQRPDQQGRLAVVFQVLQRGSVLCVSLLQSQALFNNRLSEGGVIQTKVFLLPAEPHKVEKVLLAKRSKLRTSQLKQYGAKHYATNSPTFDEDMFFSVGKLHDKASSLNLYICIAGQDLNTGAVYHGCMAFSLAEILMQSGHMPKWYWVLPLKQGLTQNQPISHELVRSHPNHVPDVIVSGRHESSPNAFINGKYVHNGQSCGNRPVYRLTGRGLVLFFHSARGAWVIADSIESNAPYAFVDDQSQLPGDAEGMWCVFSKEKEWTSVRRKKHDILKSRQGSVRGLAVGGTFQPDRSVQCTFVGHPTRSSRRSRRALAGSVRSVTTHVDDLPSPSSHVEAPTLTATTTAAAATTPASIDIANHAGASGQQPRSHEGANGAPFTPTQVPLRGRSTRSAQSSLGPHPVLLEKQQPRGDRSIERASCFKLLQDEFEHLVSVFEFIQACSDVLQPIMPADHHRRSFEHVHEALETCRQAVDEMYEQRRIDPSLTFRDASASSGLASALKRVFHRGYESFNGFCDEAGTSLPALGEYLTENVEADAKLSDLKRERRSRFTVTSAISAAVHSLVTLRAHVQELCNTFAPPTEAHALLQETLTLAMSIVATAEATFRVLVANGGADAAQQGRVTSFLANPVALLPAAQQVKKSPPLMRAAELNASRRRVSLARDVALDEDGLPVPDADLAASQRSPTPLSPRTQQGMNGSGMPSVSPGALSTSTPRKVDPSKEQQRRHEEGGAPLSPLSPVSTRAPHTRHPTVTARTAISEEGSALPDEEQHPETHKQGMPSQPQLPQQQKAAAGEDGEAREQGQSHISAGNGITAGASGTSDRESNEEDDTVKQMGTGASGNAVVPSAAVTTEAAAATGARASNGQSASAKHPAWHHGALTRQEAAQRLFGKATLVQDGLFFVYSWKQNPAVDILALVYKGKPTHHQLTRVNGVIHINKRLYFNNDGHVRTVLRTLANTDVARWPQRLTAFVPRSDCTQQEVQGENTALFGEAK